MAGLFRNLLKGESSRPREEPKTCNYSNTWDKVDINIAELIFAMLPVFDYFRCLCACKKWGPIIHSPTFGTTSRMLFPRQPWFLMFDSMSSSSAFYDKEVDAWRNVQLSIPERKGKARTPLASSNGLICFMSYDGTLTVCNPVTGSTRDIEMPGINGETRAVSMRALGSSFQLFVVYSRSTYNGMMIFSSENNSWTQIQLAELVLEINYKEQGLEEPIVLDGYVERVPLRELAGVTTINSAGHLMVYYINSEAMLVGCNTNQGIAVTYPPIGPQDEDFAFELVECGGRILVVILVEDIDYGLEVRVMEFDHEVNRWDVIAYMPSDMREIYGDTDADISCAGYGDYLMMCVSAESYNLYEVVLYNLAEDDWVKLPPCFSQPNGQKAKEFVSACAIMPDIEAAVHQ